jgi:hypothetical protein
MRLLCFRLRDARPYFLGDNSLVSCRLPPTRALHRMPIHAHDLINSTTVLSTVHHFCVISIHLFNTSTFDLFAIHILARRHLLPSSKREGKRIMHGSSLFGNRARLPHGVNTRLDGLWGWVLIRAHLELGKRPLRSHVVKPTAHSDSHPSNEKSRMHSLAPHPSACTQHAWRDSPIPF